MTHELKITNHWYSQLFAGKKKFELRNNDRNFQVGDVLKFTVLDGRGNESPSPLRWYISYVLKHDECVGLEPGYCILSLIVY